MGTLVKAPKNGAVRGAVHRHEHLSKQGLLERAFTFAFRGLVYAQIWEDPDVDMEALQITPDSHVVTIASGGCNVFSYLTAEPGESPRSISIPRISRSTSSSSRRRCICPIMPASARFFAEADRPENIALYERHIRPHLDAASRRYWEGRDIGGRRRISGFKTGFYGAGCSAI